jgi:hypothetical protein
MTGRSQERSTTAGASQEEIRHNLGKEPEPGSGSMPQTGSGNDRNQLAPFRHDAVELFIVVGAQPDP